MRTNKTGENVEEVKENDWKLGKRNGAHTMKK